MEEKKYLKWYLGTARRLSGRYGRPPLVQRLDH